MHVDLKALADHSQRIANIVLRVEQEFLGKHVQHDAILGKGDIARGIDGVANILAVNVSRAVAQGNSSAAVYTAHVASGNADDGSLHRDAGNSFGFLNGAPHRSCRRSGFLILLLE